MRIDELYLRHGSAHAYGFVNVELRLDRMVCPCRCGQSQTAQQSSETHHILPPIHLRGASQDNSEYSKATPTLFCDGARPHLELHNLRSCALAAFLVPGRVHRVARPEPAALPAGFRVVNPSGRVTGSKTQRVRYA